MISVMKSSAINKENTEYERHRNPPIFLVTGIAIGGQASAATSLIQNNGSDALVNVAQAWTEEYWSRAFDYQAVTRISN